MVRVQKPGKQAASSGGLRGPKAAKQQQSQQQRKKHKVILESVSADKSKPQNVLSFRAEPPPGYTFIPAGNPELTAALKTFASKGNREIFAVTTTPHATRHQLSREVHRVGFHFPTDVVAEVCAYYGITLTNKGTIRDEKDDDQLFMRVYQKGQLVLDEEVRDQVTINTEAKQIIKDLFPNIPDNDLFKIIKTAFQLGDGKVGTADEIPLVRRAQLSVVAHIRHTFTNYDKLLRQVPYTEARHRVEEATLKKLVEWRGDGDDNKQAMDDTLREVLVISDDDESDNEAEDGQILERDDLSVQPVARSNVQNPNSRGVVSVYAEDEPMNGYRYAPQLVRRVPPQDQHAAAASRQQSRFARWDQIRQQYKSTVNARPQEPARVIERSLIEDPYASHIQPQFVARESVYTSDPIPRGVMDPPVRVMQPSVSFVRGTDGKIYQEISTNTDASTLPLTPRRAYTPPSVSYTKHYRNNSHPGSPKVYVRPPHRRTPSFENSDGTVLPSIEVPASNVLSPPSHRHIVASPQHTSQSRTMTGSEYDPRRPALIDLTYDVEHVTKRRRLQATPPSPYFEREIQQNVPVSRYRSDYNHDARVANHKPRQYIDLTEELHDGPLQASRFSSQSQTIYNQDYHGKSGNNSVLSQSFDGMGPVSQLMPREGYLPPSSRDTMQVHSSSHIPYSNQPPRFPNGDYQRSGYDNGEVRSFYRELPPVESYARVIQDPVERVPNTREAAIRYVRIDNQQNTAPTSRDDHSYREYNNSSASFSEQARDHHVPQVANASAQFQPIPAEFRAGPTHRSNYHTRSAYVTQ